MRDFSTNNSKPNTNNIEREKRCKRETRELTWKKINPTRRSCNGRGRSHQHEAEAGGQNGGEKTKVTNKEKTHLRGGENGKGEDEARRRERKHISWGSEKG